MRHFLFCLMILSVAVSCSEEYYYEPELVEIPDAEAGIVPYDNKVIPAAGDTCWFIIEYRHVATKAYVTGIYKKLRFEILIDGNKYGETHIKEEYRTGGADFVWWEGCTGKPWPEWPYCPVLFVVPQNSSADERTVEVVASVNESFNKASDEWGEWFSVFECMQEGFSSSLSGR
ncbi:MAG: hypothetical protein IJ476_09020 [Bacteroidales bacterium]|nr:hypothetical protein [Bacteroidales bacterium]